MGTNNQCKRYLISIDNTISVPGTEVPRATKAMAFTESLRKMKQPKWPATSPMTAVQTPIMQIETTKHGYPLAIPVKNLFVTTKPLSPRPHKKKQALHVYIFLLPHDLNDSK